MHPSKGHHSLNFDNFWHTCAGPAPIKLESIITLPLPPALPPGNHCPDFSHQVSFAYSRTLCKWNHAVCSHSSFTQCNILGWPKRLSLLPNPIFAVHPCYNCPHICMHLSSSSDSKAFTCNARDLALILGSGRSPGEGNGNPLQYSCLENSMDRGAC